MPSLVVIGAQWGDEGKGKIVDVLATASDWVVRFHGGHNAGHTLVVNGNKIKLNLIPSGIMQPKTRCLIGAGVVIDPSVLLKEITGLRERGVEINPARLLIDERAQLVLPYHPAIDQARETILAGQKIGTTGRGIGPAYEERARRTAILCAELRNLESVREKIKIRVGEVNRYFSGVLGIQDQVSFEEVWDVLVLATKEVTPFLGDGSQVLCEASSQGLKILFEGAQGTLLDPIFGTVPYVTSSSTLAGAVCTGCGIGPKHLEHVLGVTKAYTTRVGSGPFPTELHDTLGAKIRERGGEFGTVTGRPRRCGWFDAVLLRYAVQVNGIDSLAVTKLDVLSGIEKIMLCTHYLLDGKKLSLPPILTSDLERAKPCYEELHGWEEDLQGINSWESLPSAAKAYLNKIEETVNCPIGMLSLGPEREKILYAQKERYLKSFVCNQQ